LSDSSSKTGANQDIIDNPIELFLTELAPILPRKKRLDVMNELRSNLHDRVEMLTANGMAAHTAALQAVAELGDPNNLAAGYGGGRVIIPATGYHIFKTITFVIVGLHLAACILATIVGLDITLLVLRIPNMRGWQAYEVVTTLATLALADIGFITILFWLTDLSRASWLPSMVVRPRAAEAKPHWSGLILPLVVLGLLNVWRNDVLALHWVTPDGWSTAPILAKSFVDTYLWPVNIVLLAALGVHTYKFISGPTAAVAAAECLYRLALFTLIGALLGAPMPFDLPPGQLDLLEPLFIGLFRLAMLATLFMTAFSLYRAGARFVQRLR